MKCVGSLKQNIVMDLVHHSYFPLLLWYMGEISESAYSERKKM